MTTPHTIEEKHKKRKLIEFRGALRELGLDENTIQHNVDWLRTALTKAKEQGRVEEREKHERLCFENGMQFIGHLQHRCPQCGKESQTKMSWLESYKINALWGRCFECASKDNSSTSLSQ